MNSNDYLSSGILENYVLGLTTESEAREVERLAALHPEIREELTAIEHALENFAVKNQVTPPPALKQKIWSAIQESEATAGSVTEKSAPSAPANKQPEAKVIPMLSKKSALKYAVAASVILLIGSAAMNVVLYIKLAEVHHQLSLLESEKNTFAQQLQTQQAAYHTVESELALVSLPATKKIVLKGVEKFPDALAMVFFNPSTKQVYLQVKNLPVAAADKQYQLWAIVDGKPVDAGVFELNNDLNRMKDFESAQAFAVTLEKKGGSPAPTMDAMYVIGNI